MNKELLDLILYCLDDIEVALLHHKGDPRYMVASFTDILNTLTGEATEEEGVEKLKTLRNKWGGEQNA